MFCPSVPTQSPLPLDRSRSSSPRRHAATARIALRSRQPTLPHPVRSVSLHPDSASSIAPLHAYPDSTSLSEACRRGTSGVAPRCVDKSGHAPRPKPHETVTVTGGKAVWVSGDAAQIGRMDNKVSPVASPPHAKGCGTQRLGRARDRSARSNLRSVPPLASAIWIPQSISGIEFCSIHNEANSEGEGHSVHARAAPAS
ncbi:hypothetical protein BD311DRAFT_737849 [Dichomitus squalens]|uniref:Uncharacterized protein n=1 Tax=Dichomitus squalens TaxID=114155 RepID=A0A4Q9MSP9_9APHY|nr:hypothetical protein BD311DRAFT_737849 [Dichomitus squalens]